MADLNCRRASAVAAYQATQAEAWSSAEPFHFCGPLAAFPGIAVPSVLQLSASLDHRPFVLCSSVE